MMLSRSGLSPSRSFSSIAALICMGSSCREAVSVAAAMQSVTGLSASAHAYRRAYVLLALVVILWGANWPVMKVALSSLPPLWFTVLRLLLGSGALFIAVGISGNLSRPGRPDLM